MGGTPDRSVSTGRIAVGRVVLDVGAPEGAIVRKVRARRTAPPPELAQALAAPEPERRPIDVAEQAVASADEVTADVEHAASLLEKLLRGQIDVATIAGELERLLGRLTALDGAGRYGDVLRLARVLVRLLTLAGRWVALVQTLRIAAHAARELADSEALAWVLHELGTLAFGAEDAQAATRDLEEACRRREAQGDVAALRATQHNLRAARRRPPSFVLRAGVPALLVGLVVGLALAGGDDPPPPTDTTDTSTTVAPPPPPPPPPPPASGDTTPPRPTLALAGGTRELTNDATPGFAGDAGSADGDQPTVTVQVFKGAEPTGEPVQEITARRGADGRYAVTATELASGDYSVRAEQRDEAGNVGRSTVVQLTVDRDPPQVTILAPPQGTRTDESPDFRGTAGTAEGDAPAVTLSFDGRAEPVEAPVETGGSWARTVVIQAMLDEQSGNWLPVTATVEQTDAAGNSTSRFVTFTPQDSPD